ncbi:MAG: tRNA (guanosine(37)-N1)-methyltransferase TrmD [Candidatus Wildermuthbacteria bacterium]|nr:tRNA (guanosine(37)-N1)-methyltransferase TrmD [Candidatus Wildermuthbacteria bacterium]
MIFDVITIFPELFEPFCNESLIKRAKKKGIFDIRVHNLRDWADDKHKTVDEKPFGGGLGMVMKIEPIYKAVQELKSEARSPKSETNSKIILFTPRGKKFTQKKAYEFSKLDQIIMICGRYEGIDERVARYIADEKISIGDYVLMGGELPAMIIIETVTRLIPGVIGKPEFLAQHLISKKGEACPELVEGFLEHPQYTRPEVFEPAPGIQWKAPKALLSGDHKKIGEWHNKHGKIISK